MEHDRIRWPLVILTAVCTLAIFFFPATFGPYSVVHGPVSPLRAVQAALRLQLAIIHAALGFFWTARISRLSSSNAPVAETSEFDATAFPDFDYGTILRC